MRRKITHSMLLTTGWLSLMAGLLGIVLPLLPTTPFLLLSAYRFSKSSPRFHQWLLDHRQFGPVIRQWESNRAMERGVKIKAIFLIIFTFGISLLLIPASPLIQGTLVVLALIISWFLASLPEPKPALYLRVEEPEADN